jgi:hypothetical protein
VTALELVSASAAGLEFVSAFATGSALVFASGAGLTAVSVVPGLAAAFEFVLDSPATHADARPAIPQHKRK